MERSSGALEATVLFSYDREQVALLAADIPHAGMLDLECPCPQKMRLRVTADAWLSRSNREQIPSMALAQLPQPARAVELADRMGAI
jgi:hypothetical protein